MPWCPTCEIHRSPGSLAPDGTCATCGEFIASPDDEVEEDSSAPWHFYLLVVALVLYIGWRVVQLIGEVIDWL